MGRKNRECGCGESGDFCKCKNRKGFTLIELSLSLIFIAVLSVTVVLLIQNTTAAYRRGMIMNQINTVGMDLVDDFRISVQNASSDPVRRMCELYYLDDSTSRNACDSDNANSFVYVMRTAQVTADGNNLGEIPVFGAFCTGTYTYIWKSGYYENAEYTTRTVSGPNLTGRSDEVKVVAVNEFNDTIDVASNFRLLKIYDDERSICVNAMKDQGVSGYKKIENYTNSNIRPTFTISAAMLNASNNAENAIDILKQNEASDLVLYDLYVAKPANSTTRQNMFYSAAFILGTRRGGINITSTGNACRPPSNDYSELEYCAINKFNFAVMAGGA